MSEEEKKAIEYIKFKIKDFEERYGTKITTVDNEHNIIILNLIEKQQKELEKEKEKTPESVRKQFETYQDKICELEEKLKIAVAMLTKGTYPEQNEGDNDFDKYYISKNKIKKLLENEIIDISGFRCIAVEDIENLLEEK